MKYKKLIDLQNDYREIFKTEAGKRVLKDLEERCFIKRPTLARDSLGMAFNEGKRTVCLHIQDMLTRRFVLKGEGK